MKSFLFPYKMESESCKALADTISLMTGKRLLRIHPDGNFRADESKQVFNWGYSSLRDIAWNLNDLAICYNKPEFVTYANNKMLCFTKLAQANVPTVEFTFSKDVAKRWTLECGELVYCRENISGMGGNGIVLASSPEEIDESNARLFTKSVTPCREYRVHVAFGSTILLQQKKRRSGNTSDDLIRNHDNGWVFCCEDITPPPDDIHRVANNAIGALGLDYGAVDIVTKRNANPLVLEVNTAPGLGGESTLNAYAQAFVEMM